MYDNQVIKDDGTVKQEKITVPREDITIAPIFRALPGTKKITDKPNSRKQVITDLVNKSIKKSDSNVKSDKEHKKENTDNSDKEYVVKYEELKKISNSANTQTGILNGFKL